MPWSERPRPGAALTDHEIRLLALVAQGMDGPQICIRMFISNSTLHTHFRRIYVKLGAQTRAHAVALAYQRRILLVPYETDTSEQQRSAWVGRAVRSGNARSLRQQAGLTQRQVADRCGAAAFNVRSWESARSQPTGDRLTAYYVLLRSLQTAARSSVGDRSLSQ